MSLRGILSWLPAAGVTTPIVHAFVAFFRASKAPPAGSRQLTTTKDTPMADTASPAVVVQKYAGAIFGEISKLGTEWSAVEASPLYGPLISAGESLITGELTKNDVAVPPLVNVGKALVLAVQSLAASSPAIATP